MQGCLGRIVQAHQGQTVFLVVHGGVVEAAFAYFVGQGLKLFEGGHPAAGHTSLTLWRQAQPQGGWVQEFANDTSHLRGTARP